MSDAAENDSRLTMFVAGECNQGGRDHLEDFILIPETEENGDAFFAVFDGHGGQEAAKYARDNLWQTIKASEGFDSSNPVKMTKAIVAGFVQTHEDMWKVRGERYYCTQSVSQTDRHTHRALPLGHPTCE